MNEFGNRLRQLRLEKGLYQKDLGNHFSFSQRQIQRFENGDSEVSLKLLNDLADFFDVSVDFLLGRTEIRNPYISEDNQEDKD